MKNFLLCISLLCALAATPVKAGQIVLILGESTSWGVSCWPPANGRTFGKTLFPPEITLSSNLNKAPSTCQWRRPGQVINWSLPGTATFAWATIGPSGYCQYLSSFLDSTSPDYNPAFKRACDLGVPVGTVINQVLIEKYGHPADIVLITMGTNDFVWNYTPQETVDNILTLKGMLAPSEVRIAPPMPRVWPLPADWPDQVRQEEINRGVITGPDWFDTPPDLCEGFHESDGGWLQFAGAWYENLCPTPHYEMIHGTGTITVFNTVTTTVTGLGTHFTSEVIVGDSLYCGGQVHAVTAIASDTSLTIATPFNPTVTNLSFDIQRRVN